MATQQVLPTVLSLPPAAPDSPHHMKDAAKALIFMLAGNAHFTVKSLVTGARYTYRVSMCKDNPDLFFVSVLTGHDNNNDYSYIGIIRQGQYMWTKKACMGADSVPVQTFGWLYGRLLKMRLSSQIEFWHEGRCGRCNRKLTVPESIEAGIGPECAGKLGVQ